VRSLAISLILFAMLAAGLALRYASGNLGIDTDTVNMLAADLPFRVAYERYRREFPQHVDQIIVVIDGQNPELADAAAHRLADSMAGSTGLFAEVYNAGAEHYFRENALLYLDEDELVALAARIAEFQPVLATLNRAPSLANFFDLLEQSISHPETNSQAIATVLTELDQAIVSALNGQHYAVSWRRLMLGDTGSKTATRRYVFLKPVLDFNEPLAAEPAMLAIRAAITSLEMTPAHGVRARITGDAALGYEELISAMDGAITAGILALIMVTSILIFGLGSISLMLASLITLVIGLSFTIAFAAFAIGHLNLISIAFAVLYIGLGVDYAIHFCLRYREKMVAGESKIDAILGSIKDLRGTLILCTLTTATAFFAFLPTAFAGVSELGLISGTGMFINLGLTLTLLPACLMLLPAPGTGRLLNVIPENVINLPLRFARPIRRVALLLGILAIFALPQLYFDRNPLNLRDQQSESVATLQELMRDRENPGQSITVLASDALSARKLGGSLSELTEVREIRDATSLLPDVTAAKLREIGDLARLVGPDLGRGNSPATRPSIGDLEVIRNVAAGLRTFNQSITAQSANLAEHLEQYADRVASADSAIGLAHLQNLQQQVFANFDPSLSRLRASLSPAEATLADLPEQLQRRWINADGLHRVAVYPSGDINDNQTLRQFVERVQDIFPAATDEPVLALRAGDAVVKAFVQAFSLALIAIVVLLLIILRDVRATFLVIAPLLLGCLLIAATMAIFSLPFNFANVIALPLLFGISVDHCIHIVMRSRSEATNPLLTSTARAVTISSLTTLCSFANLLLSPHPGTASMGLLLTIGIIIMLATTLIVLPGLLKNGTKKCRSTSPN
jgi:hopanoid biosynthesis associated RND transporter like protein HpnN